MNRSLPSFASLASVSLGLALVACGGDGGGDPGTITPDVASESVTEVGNLAEAMVAQDGESAALGVQAMIALNQGILLPDQAPRVSSKPDAAAVAPVLHGSVECTEGGCVFDHFGDDSPEWAWEIDGTITRTGDRYEFAIDYDVTVAPTHLHWRMEGWMTVTPTQIDGEIHVAADGETDGSSIDWDVTVVYNAIILDVNGCAIGGQIDARSIFTSEGRTIFDLEGLVTFGPACGEIH